MIELSYHVAIVRSLQQRSCIPFPISNSQKNRPQRRVMPNSDFINEINMSCCQPFHYWNLRWCVFGTCWLYLQLTLPKIGSLWIVSNNTSQNISHIISISTFEINCATTPTGFDNAFETQWAIVSRGHCSKPAAKILDLFPISNSRKNRPQRRVSP